MFSRLAAGASGLLTLFAVITAVGITRSPDSDLKVGVISALLPLAFAGALGLLAWWTRKGQDHGE